MRDRAARQGGHPRPDLRARLLIVVERLNALGIRPPKRLLGHANSLRKMYQRSIAWPRLARRVGLTRVVEVRRHPKKIGGLGRLTAIGADRTVVVAEKRYQRFLGSALDFPRNRHTFPAPFVCSLDRPYLHVRTGAIISRDGALVVESVNGKVERFLSSATLPKAVLVRRGVSTTIMHGFHRNYYHWLVDCLSRTYLLSQVAGREPMTLLVPQPLDPFQRRSLECCVPDHVEVQEISDEWVQPERLIFPSPIAEPPAGLMPAECLAYLIRQVKRRLAVPSRPRQRRRIYMSRAMTSYRRVVNEDAVIDRLVGHGFEVVRPEELTFDAQVRLFHSAEIVIGARGAAFANVMFSSDASVLEITSASPFVGTAHFSLCYALRHRYHYLLARSIGSDLKVDLNALDASLLEMGVSKRMIS